jgi:hypothetical protein
MYQLPPLALLYVGAEESGVKTPTHVPSASNAKTTAIAATIL